tara:strand:- start:339 stop:776 length:438 start_codon:yes stop_codon:yes gene_type:complete
MKVIISHKNPQQDSHTWIQDISSLDILVDDAEATEIIVDCTLCTFDYNNIGSILGKIMSKLRLNGKIIIYEKDIDIVCHNYNKSGMNIQDLNSLIFEDTPAVACLLNTEVISDLLKQAGLTIEEKFVNNDTMQSIIIARRNKNAA